MLGILEKYEFLISWILLPIEIVFLYFVLKEFRYIKKEQEEKEYKEMYKKIQYFALICITMFKKHYKKALDTDDKHTLFSIVHNYNFVDIKICKQISDQTKLPFEFCKSLVIGTLKMLTEQFIPYQKINYYDVYDYLFNWCNSIFTKEVFTKRNINDYRKFFKNDKEIEELYNKLISPNIDDKKI